MGKKAISVQGPNHWNLLPNDELGINFSTVDFHAIFHVIYYKRYVITRKEYGTEQKKLDATMAFQCSFDDFAGCLVSGSLRWRSLEFLG